MDAETVRAFLLTLPHVTETLQWGDRLVFRVGDRSQGGKMFCVVALDADRLERVCSFAAGPDRFAEFIEREGFSPAPYLARAHWVAASDWGALRPAEWQAELRNAHAIVLAKLPKRTREQLESTTARSAPGRSASAKRARKKAARPKRSASGSR